jgi:hypothetical protein
MKTVIAPELTLTEFSQTETLCLTTRKHLWDE